MERLTFRTEDGRALPKDGCHAALRKAIDRLAYYEDMEEQGRLALPCKPGDKVFRVVRWGKNKVSIRERIISTVEYIGDGNWIIHSTGDDLLGKRCFLTREEAEKALPQKVYEQVQDEVDQHNRKAMDKIAAFIEPKEGVK